MREILFRIVFLALIGMAVWLYYKLGYRRGYNRGRKDCERWVCELDSSVEREREKMWKEGI